MLLGTPFAEEKQQPLSDKGTFLGLDYDFTEVWSAWSVFFWVRERLETKVVTMMTEARSSGILMPSQASKLCGTLNFLESGGLWPCWLWWPATPQRPSVWSDVCSLSPPGYMFRRD